MNRAVENNTHFSNASQTRSSTVSVNKPLLVLYHLQIDDYSLVRFTPLDITDEDSIGALMYEVDNAIQYGEDLEPKDMPVSLFCVFF